MIPADSATARSPVPIEAGHSWQLEHDAVDPLALNDIRMLGTVYEGRTFLSG